MTIAANIFVQAKNMLDFIKRAGYHKVSGIRDEAKLIAIETFADIVKINGVEKCFSGGRLYVFEDTSCVGLNHDLQSITYYCHKANKLYQRRFNNAHK